MPVRLGPTIIEPRRSLSDRPWKPHRRRGARGDVALALLAGLAGVAIIAALIGFGAVLGWSLAG